MKNLDIFLFTDFGLNSPFAGIMKGVIKQINPSANVIDINHEIPAYDIKRAAFEIMLTGKVFDRGIFVCVVDPGVGSKRKIIFAKVKQKFFLAPDNGVLSWVFAKEKIDEIFEVTNTQYFLPNPRSTFDGRDVFAPVSAWLSKGIFPKKFGKKIKEISKFEIPCVKKLKQKLLCKVVYIDSFGNCWTNIEKEKFNLKFKKAVSKKTKVKKFSSDYSGRENIMVFNSFSFLEFSTPQGNFAKKNSVKIGDKFEVFYE